MPHDVHIQPNRSLERSSTTQESIEAIEWPCRRQKNHMAHNHSNEEGHSHAPANFGRAFAIGTLLNAGFVVVEFIYGYHANSLALMADAGHNLGDVLGLLAAWGASVAMQRRSSPERTYGLKGSTILAALGNAVLLLVTTGGIAWEAIQRVGQPVTIHSSIVITVAAIGILVNGFTALMFMHGTKDDLNVKAAFQHMAYDALIAFGVVIGGVIMWQTGFGLIDPLLSLVICLVIIWGTWGLLKDSVHLALQGTPRNISHLEVQQFLQSIAGVVDVHDLHIWAMSTTEPILTAHMVIRIGEDSDMLLDQATRGLHDKFGIEHTTLQIERFGWDCAVASTEVI